MSLIKVHLINIVLHDTKNNLHQILLYVFKNEIGNNRQNNNVTKYIKMM